MKTPHKHADCIKAWADGADIELQASNGIWMNADSPDWSWPEGRYRIKPEPKPNLVLFYSVKDYDYTKDLKSPKVKWTGSIDESNLHLSFDATTNKLIKAEVI